MTVSSTTVHSSGEMVEAVLSQLRAEEPLEHDGTQAAMLRHECGVLEEARGDLDAAVREYLAAFNSDPEFREPLEALVRIHFRRRDESHLGKLLEAMVDSAATPLENARALYELAVYRAAVLRDIDQAKACLEKAVEVNSNDVASWLELELAGSQSDDIETRMRAREARANLTLDPTWQGHLLIELAELCAGAGDLERAASLLDTVVALDGRARFRSRLALEFVAMRAKDIELQAHALEGQAELIVQGLDDPDLAARCGVPSTMATVEHAADAWLRAGELRRRNGDAWGAVAALSGAAARLENDALVARLNMAAADAAGDLAAAVKIAKEQLAAGVGGPAGAALWLRLGQAAEASQDIEGALEAYTKALELEPRSTPLLCLRTDLYAQGEDASALAEALEAQAPAAGSEGAQARAWVTVGYVWAVRVGNVERGKAALEQARALGTPAARLSRMARSFAALAGDEAWYEEATARLLEDVGDAPEGAALAFELGRSRLLRGEDGPALEAFTRLAERSNGDGEKHGSTWLGRVLAAYAVRAHGRRDPDAVARLAKAEPDVQLARGLTISAAMMMARSGNLAGALELLGAEHQRDPADVVVAVFLADLRRSSGDRMGAAQALVGCAGAGSDTTLSGALQLEAGLLLWTVDRAAAVAAFEQAQEYTPTSAQLVLTWAIRAERPDDAEARARAIDLAEEVEGDPAVAALERFGLRVADRQEDGQARAAIEQLEDLNAGGDIALAAALARLLWPAGDEAGSARALELIEQLEGSALQVARGERFRVARFIERDATSALKSARDWAEVDDSVAAALEWLAAAYASDDRDAEIDARVALSERVDGNLAASVASSAAVARLLHQPGRRQPLLPGSDTSARLLNLELAAPGAEPQRRSAALRGLGDALGEEGARDALRLAAWSDLAAGENVRAQKTFKQLVEANQADMASLEGLRASSEAVGDFTSAAISLARLGSQCRDDERAAGLWENAGLLLLEHTKAHDDAEIAFQRALDRDKTRAVAFDKLFRRVRARKENDRLLKLIALRLEVTDSEPEIVKMYWERARVYRDKDDNEQALKCLTDVTMLEPDHVGALALAGEINIKKGDFAAAAPLLARLAMQPEAPNKQRLLSGIAAVDLYEKRLDQHEEALKVLSRLYKDGLSTLKVRERLARTAARVGNWSEAVSILERLMEERDNPAGRAEAARLAMAIYRDKLRAPQKAAKSVARLLAEVPDDREAVELLLSAPVSDQLKAVAVPTAKRLLLQQLAKNPLDLQKVQLVADIAAAQNDLNLRRAALGCAVALGSEQASVVRGIIELDARTQSEPQIVLDTEAILAIADPDDVGPIPELFALSAPVISEAMGPSVKSEDVGRRQRIDTGHPLRNAVSRWMGAIGFNDFDVYVGGRDPQAIKGIAGDQPALVIGTAIPQGLDAASRSAIAREVFALRRGTTAVLHCDDNTIASLVVALVRDAGFDVPDPPYAIFREVERAVKKAMSRRVRNAIKDVSSRVIQERQDAPHWAAAARRSIDRMQLIASGDAAIVVSQMKPPAVVTASVRAQRLLSFALSPEYLQLRQKLRMGIA
jgi:tetratricopeptide (TPR) repeat protein